MAALALVAGLSGLTAAPAAAVEDTDHVALPTTGYVPEVVAATGTGIILAPAKEDDSTYRVSSNNGQDFFDLVAQDFTGHISYVGNSTAIYFNPTGDSDDTGTFFNLYTYNLIARTAGAPTRVYAAAIEAVTPDDAVVANEAGGYSVVHLATGQATALTVPDRGGVGPAFTLSTGTAALAATVQRDGSDVLGAGYLDAVPLAGAAGPTLGVAGLATARVSGGRAYWVKASGAGAEFCFASASTLASPICRPLATGNYSQAVASIEAGPGWVVARVRPASGATAVEKVYLPVTDSLTSVTAGAGMQSVRVYGRGDTATPLATVLAADGGYIGSYSAGTVTHLFDLPTTTATTSTLFVTPRSVSGLDDRPAAGVSGKRGWARPLDGTLGAEAALGLRATGLSVSADRMLLSAADGVHVFDAGTDRRTLPAVTNARSLSGPFFLSGPDANATVMRVDGTTVLPSAGHVVALFGALALRSAGSGYEVVDANHAATVFPVDLPGRCGAGTFVATGLWGDWVLAADDSGGTVVLNYRDSSACRHHSGAPTAIGDGFALVSPDNPVTSLPDVVAWNFTGPGSEQPVASNPSTVATDGSHKVAWTDATDLWAGSLDDVVTPSAPRVLGVLAQASVTAGLDWKLDLDATKALGTPDTSGGSLVIRDAGSAVVARIALAEAPNGSLRNVTWGGSDTGGVPVGAYTWELELTGSDGTQGTAASGTVTVAAGTPLTGTRPTLSTDSPAVDSPVTAIPGAWGPSTRTLTYQWFAGGVAIYQATHDTYTPAVDDREKALTVAVTGKAPGHSPVTLTSEPSQLVDWLAGPEPTVSGGTPVVGKKLTANPGTWAPASVNSALTYQWYRGAAPIDGATATTYVLATTDLGHTVHVRVTGRLLEHTSFRESVPTAMVISPSFAPLVPVLSTLRPVVGQELTASPGYWGTDVTFSYKWYRVSSKARVIPGATTARYTPTAKDVGYKLKVQVTGIGQGTKSLYSKVTSKVKKGSFVLTTPLSITGTPKVGMSLTVGGGWSTPPTLKYQWYRGSKAIRKTNRATYLLTAADLHKVMKVKVTATRPGYNTVVKTVKLATPIAPAV